MTPAHAQETPPQEGSPDEVSPDEIPPDEAPTEAPPEEPTVEPEYPRLPVLEFAPSAPYPAEALEAGEEGAVLLEMDISEGGEVLSVTLLEPAGWGFDEAAMSAVRNFQFAPALDEAGEPAVSRIQYRYRFTLEDVPILAIEGRIMAAGIRQPLPDARVVLLDAAGMSLEVFTDAEGFFRFADVVPGPYALAARAAGRSEEVASIEVVEGRISEVTLYLVPDRAWEGEDYNDQMVIVGQRVEPEIVERSLDASEIRTMPGTGGDIVRAVQSLPGVARS
ncbi:MAG: TonB family protein, partial [Myxococcota bacterium]